MIFLTAFYLLITSRILARMKIIIARVKPILSGEPTKSSPQSNSFACMKEDLRVLPSRVRATFTGFVYTK